MLTADETRQIALQAFGCIGNVDPQGIPIISVRDQCLHVFNLTRDAEMIAVPAAPTPAAPVWHL